MGTIMEDLAAHDAADQQRNLALEDARADLAAAVQRAESLSTQLGATERDLTTANAEVTALEGEVNRLRARIAELEGDTPDPDPEPVPAFPLLPSIALNPKTDANYNRLAAEIGVNDAWILRAYHGGAFKPLNEFGWLSWARERFAGLIFSTQHGTSTASYAATARGDHDATWRRIVDSWPAGMVGGINLGNEANLEDTTAEAYRDALEHLIETFELPPGVFWTVALSNYRSWTVKGRAGAPGHEGEKYLPRTTKRILVLTHTYGKDQWPDPADQQSMFHAEMDKHPTWLRGVGETSAQEKPGDPEAKARYLVGAAQNMARHGASVFSLFDSGTGGSDEIASTPTTAARVKAWADTVDGNRWTV